MHHKLGSMTLLQLTFLGESYPHFLWEKSQWDNTVVKKKKDEKFKTPPYVCSQELLTMYKISLSLCFMFTEAVHLVQNLLVSVFTESVSEIQNLVICVFYVHRSCPSK